MNPSLFSPAIAPQLDFYVYIYINPLDGRVFYVGKGRGNRAFSHLNDPGPSAKTALISEIRAAGKEPRIEVLVHGLKDEDTALKIEAAVIDLLGKDNLTNEVGGYQSRSHGRMTLDQIRALYGAVPVAVTESALLIRINRLYRHTMTDHELYDTTRGYWKIGPDREKAKFAMAVYAGVVREVYEIQAWFPACSTFTTRLLNEPADPERWEFVGRIADEGIRRKYRFRDVSQYFARFSQNPIVYLNVK
ncbi:MAG TPA: hypothetical protein VK961_16655 [Chthoniobacter sp.]|nr:hypothetical protein [Chthoniobacter sp.]